MYGPTAGARVAVSPNMACPTPWRFLGIMVTTTVNAVGMNTPPVKPLPGAEDDHLAQVGGNAAHAREHQKQHDVAEQVLADGENPLSQAVSGMVMISPMR